MGREGGEGGLLSSASESERSEFVRTRLVLGGEDGVVMVAVGCLLVACTPVLRMAGVGGVGFFLSALANAKNAFNFFWEPSTEEVLPFLAAP